MPLNFADVVRLATLLPSVEESTSYGTPALKVKGKLMARLREDGTTSVLRVPFVVRDHLITTDPAVFFLTEQYRNYPYMLVRLQVVPAASIKPLLAEAWRHVAPKRMIAARDKADTQ